MELRGCSQFHFIAVIKGGGVIKTLNIAQGKTRPKYMNIEDIYSSCDSKSCDSLAKYPPKVDRSLATSCDFDKVKTEVKIEEVDNELDFDAVTLRQLKHICKSHKRKASRSVYLTTIKQEVSDLQLAADELCLKETLGSWKRKVLMKTKAKKKGIVKSRSRSSTTCDVGGRLQETPTNLTSLDTSKHCKPPDVKAEYAEHDSLNLSDDPGNLRSDTVGAVEYGCPVQDPMLRYLGKECLDQLSHENPVQPLSIGKSTCCLNQVSYEHLDCAEVKNPLNSENSKIEVTIEVDNSVVIGDHSLNFCGSEEPRGEAGITDIMTCDEPTETVLLGHDSSDMKVDKINYLHVPSPHQLPPNGDTSEAHIPCMVPCNDSQSIGEAVALCNVSQHIGEAIELMDDNRDIKEAMRSAASNCNLISKFDICLPPVNDMSSLDNTISAVEDKQLPVLDVSTEEMPTSPASPKSNCHNSEFSNNGEAGRSMVNNLITEEKSIRRLPENCDVALQNKECLPLVTSIKSLHNVTSGVEDNESLMLDNAAAPLTCFADIRPSNDMDQHIKSAASKGCYENKLEQQPPERLFSARKMISPDSKERLCRAMNCTETQDDTSILPCRENLLFEKICVDTSSRSNLEKTRIMFTSKRLEALRTAENRSSSWKTLKKGRYERKLSVINGTVNGLHASPLLVHAPSTCSTSQSCSQNAIAFSKQQMVDSERLAIKLLSELQSMKEMVVDTLHSDPRTCTTSRYNADKARVAVENAKKVEETTKRWLSMMARDCNRFCKIMELSETNGASPEKSNIEHILDSKICNDPILDTEEDEQKLSPTSRKVRKIIFADEAGESLCHVKVL
ncbi:hypothetical protein BVRB_1g013540 [Beta vulgaris subsp. vulgaris]|nr:hypothetical protein BVRB_1g013540 [Beta vulgaris subsp. vulgaris]